MKIQDAVDYVFEIAPNPDGMTENKYLFRREDTECRGIGVAWWLTSEIISDMHANGINLGFCHEPVFFEGLEYKPFLWGPTPTEAEFAPNFKLKKLLEQTGVTVHRFHSNLDKADFGMIPALLNRLGWDNYPRVYAGDLPCVTLPEQTLKSLAEELKNKLQLPYIKYDGDPDRIVSKAVIAWGGLCQFWGGPMCASLLAPDVIIGGDIIDGVVRIGREMDLPVIDALHCATEMDGMAALAEKLQLKFDGIPVKFYRNRIPFPNIV